MRAATRKIQLKKMAKPSTVTEPPKPLSSGALMDGSHDLLAVEAEASEEFGQHDEDQQEFALPGVGEDQEIEEQDGAGEQRQHDGRDDREVIRCGVELAHVHHWPPPAFER